MKPLLAAATATTAMLSACSAAEAFSITKTVPAGQTTTVYTYTSRTHRCESASGTVTLVVKPQHGQVTYRSTPTTFTGTRDDNFGSPGRCHGKPTMGFVITYTPAPGFRGVDHFTIEVRMSTTGVHRLDGYAVIVE
jgi:hypothetical protein